MSLSTFFYFKESGNYLPTVTTQIVTNIKAPNIIEITKGTNAKNATYGDAAPVANPFYKVQDKTMDGEDYHGHPPSISRYLLPLQYPTKIRFVLTGAFTIQFNCFNRVI